MMIDIFLNPFFLIPLIVVIMYLIVVALVFATGSPRFARNLPIAKRAYKVKVTVYEERATGKRKRITYGRRIQLSDMTQRLETILYGDIKNIPISLIVNYGSGDEIELVMSESGEFHPLTIIKLADEHVKIPDRDPISGQILKNEDGTIKMRELTTYGKKPWSQDQRIFFKNAFQESLNKYNKNKSLIDKIAPYAGIMIMGIIIVIMIAVLLQNIGTIADKLSTAKLCTTQVVQQAAQNFTY
jgi:uncharacterized membrane protein YbaN (DUF454 family)